MRAVLLLLVVSMLGGHVFAQKINFGKKTTIRRNIVDPDVDQKIKVEQLFNMLDWTQRRIDTTMKNKGYLLMQKDVDSTSSLFLYSSTDHVEEGPTTIRSLTLMDAEIGNYRGRKLNYRTYDKDEFGNISGSLLAHNFQKTKEYMLGDEKHSIYSNGSQTIHLKILTTTLKTKQTFTAYELELGR